MEAPCAQKLAADNIFDALKNKSLNVQKTCSSFVAIDLPTKHDHFDWDVTNGVLQHDDGYDLLTADGVFLWITPQPLIRTQCSFHSVLDFVFVANSAKTWLAVSAILEAREDYCPDTDETSDHRPVLATFQLTASERPSTKTLLLERIQRMEEEIQALKALIEQLQE